MKLKIYIIAVVIFCSMAITISLLLEKVNRISSDRDQALEFIRRDSIELSYYKSKYNTEIAKSERLTLSVYNAQKLINTERLAWIKQFNGVNKRLNNLENTTKTTAQLVANFKIPLSDTTIVQPDSTVLRARKFNNNNKWIELNGIILPDTVNIQPVVNVPIQEVLYWQRKKFLFLRIGKKEYFSEVTSPNPYVKFTQHEVIRIKK
jgi:hypothetical protein